MFERPLLILILMVGAVGVIWWESLQNDRCRAAGGRLVNGPFGYVCVVRVTKSVGANPSRD